MPLLPQPAAFTAAQTIFGGAGLSFQYTYDPSVVNADPGSGRFRFDDTRILFVTKIFISNTGGQGEDVGNLISSVLLGSATVGVRRTGMPILARFQSASTPSANGVYLIKQFIDHTTYYELQLKKLVANAIPPTIARDTVISFVIGGLPSGPTWLFDTGIYDGSTQPPSGYFQMNGATIGTSGKIAVQGNTGNMGDWSGLWIDLGLTSGPTKARLILLNASTLFGGAGTQEFAMYEVTEFVDKVTFQELQIRYVDSTAVGTEAIGIQADPIIWFFQWVGVGTLLAPTTPKTANYTALPNDFIPVDTTSNPVTITLPTAPVNGTPVTVKCVARPGTNNVTVAAGGSDVFNKAGGPTTLTLSAVNQGVQLQYQSATAIWYVTGSITS